MFVTINLIITTWPYASINLSNGLLPHRQQAITLINADPNFLKYMAL